MNKVGMDAGHVSLYEASRPKTNIAGRFRSYSFHYSCLHVTLGLTIVYILTPGVSWLAWLASLHQL